MVVIILFILIVLSDALTLRDVLSSNITNAMKVFWSVVVLGIPIIGMSIYYLTKNSIRLRK